MMNEDASPTAIKYKGKYAINDKGFIRALTLDLHNTPLQGFSQHIFMFFNQNLLRIFDDALPIIARKDIQIAVPECVVLAKFLRDVKTGKVKGCGWKMTSARDLSSLYYYVEKMFLEKLDDTYDILPDMVSEELPSEILDEWVETFKYFPTRDALEFEDKELDEDGEVDDLGDHMLSLEEIDYLIKDLTRFEKIANNLTIESDKRIITRFLEHMLEAGIPHTRPVYLELYRVLDNFGLISNSVKESHASTNSLYGESNYIKSLVNTILKNKSIQMK